MNESSKNTRPTSSVTAAERDSICKSTMPIDAIAAEMNITKSQVYYIRSSEAQAASPQKIEWKPNEVEALHQAYNKLGWQPTQITQELRKYNKTRAQVYRKMMREFKGR